MHKSNWLALAAAVTLAGCQSTPSDSTNPSPPPQVAAKSNIDKIENLAYVNDGDDGHLVDLYLPKGKTHEPLLIFIHGGAWLSGDKSAYDGLGQRFANAGLAVACLNYRLSGKRSNIHGPGHVKDCALGYAWLAKNAEKYGYNPEKIFVSGHSAGAHTAAMMATGTFLQDAHVPTASMPAGYIGIEGIYDLVSLVKTFPTYSKWFVIRAFGEKPNWSPNSPALRPLVHKAPWLIIQSTQDLLVDEGQAKEFEAHLTSAGVKTQTYIKPMGNHDVVVEQMFSPEDLTGAEIIKFIRS